MNIHFNYNKNIKKILETRLDTKEKIWEIILEVSKLILVGNLVKPENAEGTFTINPDKRRIYFSQILNSDEVKHFSFQYPFRIKKEEDVYVLRTYSQDTDIQSAHVQVILSLISKGVLSEARGKYGIQLEFCSLVENTLNELYLSRSLVEDLDDILLELFLFEPSYIRYDEDLKNENGRIHPLNHFDIFYSQQTTFKLGIENRYNFDAFLEFLCNEEECFYISR